MPKARIRGTMPKIVSGPLIAAKLFLKDLLRLDEPTLREIARMTGGVDLLRNFTHQKN